MLLALAGLAFAPADVVIENAKIWTDGRDGFARSAAVSGGRFVYVGDDAGAFVGSETRRVDAGGRLVIPGLIDSHAHMMRGGIFLSQLQLRDAASKADFIERVRKWAAALSEGKWIVGGRWSVESWQTPEQPTKEWVDAASGGRPLFLSRMDGHSALVNSAALKIAGIGRDTPNPAGGVIDKDESGEPTGILRETAMALVSRHIPAATEAETAEGLRRAIALANANGITTVCDIPTITDLPDYERLATTNRDCRIVLYPTAGDWTEGVKVARAFRGADGWVKFGGFKAYFDGSLGSRTAWMEKPFLNNPPQDKTWSGLPMPILTDGTFDKNARAAVDAGYQIIVHAIGDQANSVLLDRLLDLYDRGSRAGSELRKDIERLKAARHRSEHAQHLLPDDISRFGEYGVIPSMQPFHKADDGRYAESYIGAERCHSSYAYKSLLAGGATLAFGSDFPVVTINPFLGMEAAVTARILDGKIWEPQESISVADSLRCYTSRAAQACFMEREVGRIAPGFRADFVVLSSDLFAPGVDWNSVSALQVWVEGRRIGGANNPGRVRFGE
jgi:predicted amidohydrolase YtcJ